VASLSSPSHVEVRDIFMMILMFTDFLRESELCLLQMGDVWMAREGESDILFIFVSPLAKNDAKRVGSTTVIAMGKGETLPPARWRGFKSI